MRSAEGRDRTRIGYSLKERALVKRVIVIATIDAGSLEYLEAAQIPNIRQLMRSGFLVHGVSMLPSVTNVNNISIVTGGYPAEHGITTNYWYRPESKDGVFMESPEFVMCGNIFQRARSYGMRSAVLTSKDKLKRILEPGSSLSVSGEYPTREFIDAVGPGQPIYSAEVNHWLFRALQYLMRKRNYDLLYVATTDYIMHKFAPDDEEAVLHMEGIDQVLGEIVDEFPDTEIYLTADHGMSPKKKAVDLKRLLAGEGIEVELVPVIKDRYVVHHENLGGFCYLYILADSASSQERDLMTARAIEILTEQQGVEAVLTRTEAVERFRLLGERIGDLVVLGTQDVVFGELDSISQPVDIRSHGSTYESQVPIIGYNSPTPAHEYRENADVVRNLVLG